MLYQLSYISILNVRVEMAGLEPTTLRVTGDNLQASAHKSYVLNALASELEWGESVAKITHSIRPAQIVFRYLGLFQV